MTRIRKRDHNLLTNAVSLLVCGLLAGVVVAAAAFPAVAMSGLAAKAGAETFDKLPSELRDQRAPQLSRIYASDRKTLLVMIFNEFRNDVPLDQISKNMQNAIISAEDKGFRKHNGVDPKGIVRAFVANQGGETHQGASTLTMQYVRMSIAYSATHPSTVVAATTDTTGRKAREARLAMQIEKQLNKDQILERYLNIAPFGNGAYGVFAASQVYFKKLPKDLTVAEAALLAGLVKAPSAFDPSTPKGHPQAVDRRNYVIGEMAKTNAITPAQAAEAKAVEISRDVQRASNGCVAVAKNNWGFFCDYFLRWWNAQESLGETVYDREQRLKTGGYTIYTSMDVKTQEAAHKRIEEKYKTSNKNKNALMLAAIEPGSGKIRSLAVNRTFKLDDPRNPENGPSTNPAKKGQRGTYPNTTNPLLSGGGDITGYQAGSSFKIFSMVAALEKGIPLSHTINTKPKYTSKFPAFGNVPTNCDGKYCPSNASSKMAGPYNMWTAFGKSVNTYFIPLEEQAGARNTVEAAKKMGIRFFSKEEVDLSTKYADDWGSFTLGVSHTTPLDLANAYATLAADGTYCEPIPVEEILDHDKKKLDLGNPRCQSKRIAVDVARAAVDAARCPVGDESLYGGGKCPDGPTAGIVRGKVNHPVFGKSGTTDNDRTAILVAGTKSLVVAGILGDPDNSDSGVKMSHDLVNPAVYNTLADAMKGKEKQQFEKPGNKITFGDQRDIPNVACRSVADATARLENAGFEPYVMGGATNSPCPAGQVAETSPRGQTIKGGPVGLQLSNGNNGQPPAPPGQPGTPPGRN